MNDEQLSVNNMVEFAMGLSMSNLFCKAMDNAMQNSQRMQDNNNLNTFPQYIYAIIDGVQRGPFSLKEIANFVKDGKITPQTYIWKAGMSEWLQAENMTDLIPDMSLIPPKFNK